MTHRRSARLAALTFTCLTLAGALAPDRVEAQTVRDRLRLSADLTFFDFTRVNQSTEFGPDVDDKTTYFGFLNEGLGLSLGASIGEMLFIGGRLVLERIQFHEEDVDDASALHWTLEPFVELMFGNGPFVPFAIAGVGFEGFVADDGADRSKQHFFGFRLGGGAHIFLADGFSLDPRVELGWATDVADDDEVDESRIRFSIIVGFSGWFGGGDEAPDQASPFAAGGTDPYTGAPVAGPTGPAPTNETVETLDFGGGVSLAMAGAPHRDDLKLAFQRRGSAPVLSGCGSLVWQIDGQTAEMPVSHRSTPSDEGVTETLAGVTASNNAALLGHARVVTLTVCGASFTLTPQHLQQLSAFAQRLQGPAAAPQQDAWPPTAY